MKKIFAIIIWSLLLFSCSQPRVELPKEQKLKPLPAQPKVDLANVRYRQRDPVPLQNSRYEGSLWKGESSWGNLLRDHRARFKNDVLTIKNVQAIVSMDENSSSNPEVNTEGNVAQKAANLINAASSFKTRADIQQNEVVKSIQKISARVINVLPNGNMIVLAEKVDYRDQNRVRYVTRVTGLVRPKDVDQNNEIDATKMARPEVKVKRQVKADNSNRRTIGNVRKTAGFLEKVGHFTSTAKPKAKTATKAK